MGNGLLNRLRAAFRIELRLLVGNWIYPGLHLLWAVLLVWMFFGKDDRSAQALLETTLGRTAIGLVSLAGLFLAGISESRSRRMKFHDLEESFPTGFEVTAGRWLAGMLALTVFLLQPLAIAAYQGPPTSLLAGLAAFLAETILTVAFTSAFAWALMSWLKPGRWAHLLLAAGWLGFLLGPTLLADRYPATSLLNFMRQGVSFYSELWGRLVYGDQPFWFNLFYTGLLLLCLAVLTLSLSLRRFRRLSAPGGFLLIIALPLMAWSGLNYGAGLRANHADVSLYDGESGAFVVTAYNLTLDLSNTQQPSFSAELTALNPGSASLDELAFRLNPALRIVASSMPSERENDLVWVRLPQPLAPQESISLTFRYLGNPRVESISAGIVEASDFIDHAGVRLTPRANWYPVPSGLSVVPVQHAPARIHLAVANSGDLPISANLPEVTENIFAADDAEWIFLIGSPRLVVEQVNEVTLITSQADLAQARALANLYGQHLRAIAPFFPEAGLQGLILMVLGEESGLPERTPPTAGYPLVVTQRYSLADHLMVKALTADLWRLSGGALDPRNGLVTSLDLSFDAATSFLALYVLEKGDPERMQARLQQEQSSLDPHVVINKDQLAFMEIYRQGGQKAVTGILRQIYQKPDELRALSYESLYIWILAAGGLR